MLTLDIIIVDIEVLSSTKEVLLYITNTPMKDEYRVIKLYSSKHTSIIYNPEK